MVNLKFETVETGTKPTASVIWLHGLGADGFDFKPIVPQLGLPADPHIRFLFPHAPTMPITMNGGYIMPGWYDLYPQDNDTIDMQKQDEVGMEASAQAIQSLITQENQRGIPNHRIILIGFSQGGAMALYSGTTVHKPLAGIIALSSYLPAHDSLPSKMNQATQQTPILIAHGTQDPVVLFEYGKASAKLLQDLGYQVDWQKYPMEHSVCPEETKYIGQWITKKLPAI